MRILHGRGAEYRLYFETDGCLLLETRVGSESAVDGPNCDGGVRASSRCFRAQDHVQLPAVQGRVWMPKAAGDQHRVAAL